MKEIRKDLNLTQQEMASLLNVSRSAIAMYEKGMRELPAAASLAYNKLMLFWQQSMGRQRTLRPINSPFLQVEQTQCTARLKACQERAAATIVHITQQLSAMEQKHQKLSQQLHVLQSLMQDARPGTLQMSLLKNREQMVLIRLSKCSPERRQMLQFRLQVLTARQKAALSGNVILQQQAAVNNT
jgi:hypothetical protein